MPTPHSPLLPQLVSVKAIVLRTLAQLPFYQKHPRALASGLRVPGEIGPRHFATTATILVCATNEGARRVAEELRDASGNATVEGAEEALAADSLPSNAVLLLYLNARAFIDLDEAMAATVKRALDRNVPIEMLNEQDPSRGACPFCEVAERTPRELQLPPYRLFDTMAVALYPAEEYRQTSEPTPEAGPLLLKSHAT